MINDVRRYRVSWVSLDRVSSVMSYRIAKLVEYVMSYYIALLLIGPRKFSFHSNVSWAGFKHDYH
jgi:hypothetical protein